MKRGVTISIRREIRQEQQYKKEFILYVRDWESSQEPSQSGDTPSSEGVLDVFWAKGPFMGPVLSTGITARPGLRITRDGARPLDRCVGTW